MRGELLGAGHTDVVAMVADDMKLGIATGLAT